MVPLLPNLSKLWETVGDGWTFTKHDWVPPWVSPFLQVPAWVFLVGISITVVAKVKMRWSWWSPTAKGEGKICILTKQPSSEEAKRPVANQASLPSSREENKTGKVGRGGERRKKERTERWYADYVSNLVCWLAGYSNWDWPLVWLLSLQSSTWCHLGLCSWHPSTRAE